MKTTGLTGFDVLKLPLETKVRLSFWENKNIYWYRIRNKNGGIEWIDHEGIDPNSYHSLIACLVLQDQWEIYQEPKKKSYISGLDAIKAMYDGKMVAFDDNTWLLMYRSAYIYNGSPYPSGAFQKKYVDQNKWFIVE